MTENEAYKQLFETIIRNNGYYTNLRLFAWNHGYNFEQMATMLNNEYEKAPDGMSPYYYMDSLENMMEEIVEWNQFTDIADMVETVWERQLWKE